LRLHKQETIVFYALSWSVMLALLVLWSLAVIAFALSSTLPPLSPAIEAALGQAPASAGGLSAAVWAGWGIGSTLIVILGLVCSRLITVLRRRASLFAAPSVGTAAAN
jgi:hypothetical protein